MKETLTLSDEKGSLSLLPAIYNNGEVDLIPDYDQRTLTIGLHHLAIRTYDKVLQKLCDELITTETRFPGTNF